MSGAIFTLVVYLVVPGGSYEAHIPQKDLDSCRSAAYAFSTFPNNEKLSAAGYCEDIRK